MALHEGNAEVRGDGPHAPFLIQAPRNHFVTAWRDRRGGKSCPRLPSAAFLRNPKFGGVPSRQFSQFALFPGNVAENGGKRKEKERPKKTKKQEPLDSQYCGTQLSEVLDGRQQKGDIVA